jgi:hypothetical protein
MNLTFNTIKMKHRLLKQGLFALAFAVGSTAMAQTTDANDANINRYGEADKIVKLVDNKGTIKYLQSNNGITTITSTSSGHETTTTWQLGGELIEDTTIKLGDNEFGFEGVGEDKEERTLLVLDDNNNLKKVELNEIAGLVTGVYKPHTVVETDITDASSDPPVTKNLDITVEGIPEITTKADSNAFKLSVYRNGIKLRIIEDFTVAEGKVTIITKPLYKDDEFEIHYIE